MTAKILVVLAHPDDETFGIGGTLAKYADHGAAVALILATRGEAGIPGTEPARAGVIREAEARAACAVLGVRSLDFLDYRDGQLAQIDFQAAVRRLADRLRLLRPDVVITFGPDGVSGHPDHTTVGAWTTAAFDAAGAAGWGARLYYVAPSEATQQGCGVAPVPEQVGGPVAFIDVGPWLTTKVRAAQRHVSQDPPFQGDPDQVAARLACHEVFRLARPVAASGGERMLDDLLEDEVQGEKHTQTDATQQTDGQTGKRGAT